MTTIRTLYTEGNNGLWVEVAQRMRQLCAWEPVYWVGLDSVRQRVAQCFPRAVFHDKLEAVRGLAGPGQKGLPTHPLDQETMRAMAPCEAMVVRMLDRMDPRGDMGYRERLDLYGRYLGHWLGVLERHRPQLAFFPIPPHMAYDYVLYELCKLRGIPTLMLEQALVTSLVYPMARFEDPDTLPARAYRRLLEEDQGGQPVLTSAVAEQLDALAGSYQTPFYVRRMGGDDGPWSPRDLWLGLKSLPARALGLGRQAREILLDPPPPNYVKVKGRPYQGRPISHAGFAYYRWLGRRKKERLRAAYQKLATPPRLDAPFVYLPLHYQPEMSTMPCGGYYEDQRILAGLISRCLPQGWRLYVKEHPVQVAPVGKGHYSRDEGFYHDLLRLPNLSLVPLEQSSFQLIDHCRATATISGQAGWEAVNRGKPALVFGHAWYRGCEGVFLPADQAELRHALRRIADGKVEVDLRKVRLFVMALEQVAVRGYAAPLFGKHYNISPDENIEAIARSLSEYWRHHADWAAEPRAAGGRPLTKGAG